MMERRVYGILGISSIMANWNADFSGYPKTTSDGTTFGSDKALKYPMKRLWEEEGKKVLYLKSMKLEKDKKEEVHLIPKSLQERYEQIFQVDNLKECKNTGEIITNLFRAIDVKNFGATFAESGKNISITGAVQVGQGFNRYEGSEALEQPILSPFRDATKTTEEKGEAKNSTLGTKIVSEEAHYFYPFVINPLAYREYVEMGVTEGYTEEDYRTFKEASLVAATAFATNAKVGCENEFALFVETEPDLYLPNLSEYVTFEKTEGKNRISLTCGALFNEVKGRVEKIEVYYNPYTTVIGGDKLEGATYYNIITRNEV